jgi:hypothetical protein
MKPFIFSLSVLSVYAQTTEIQCARLLPSSIRCYILTNLTVLTRVVLIGGEFVISADRLLPFLIEILPVLGGTDFTQVPCPVGQKCTVLNSWYWYCAVPTTTTTINAHTVTTASETHTSTPAPPGGQCGGIGYVTKARLSLRRMLLTPLVQMENTTFLHSRMEVYIRQ